MSGRPSVRPGRPAAGSRAVPAAVRPPSAPWAPPGARGVVVGVEVAAHPPVQLAPRVEVGRLGAPLAGVVVERGHLDPPRRLARLGRHLDDDPPRIERHLQAGDATSPVGRRDSTNSTWRPVRIAARTAPRTSIGAGRRRMMTFSGLGWRWTIPTHPSPGGEFDLELGSEGDGELTGVGVIEEARLPSGGDRHGAVVDGDGLSRHVMRGLPSNGPRAAARPGDAPGLAAAPEPTREEVDRSRALRWRRRRYRGSRETDLRAHRCRPPCGCR